MCFTADITFISTNINQNVPYMYVKQTKIWMKIRLNVSLKYSITCPHITHFVTYKSAIYVLNIFASVIAVQEQMFTCNIEHASLF